MPLLLVSLYEFKQFLQIVLWIALPGTLIAILITTYLHYRRKKKADALELAYPEEITAQPLLAQMTQDGTDLSPAAPLPDWLASSDPGNKSLLKKYEQEIRRYKENYGLLEQDFRELEEKYEDLRTKAYSTDKKEEGALVKELQKEIKEHKRKITQLHQAVLNAGHEDQEELANRQAAITLMQKELADQQLKDEAQTAEIKQLQTKLTETGRALETAKEETVHLQQCFSQQLEALGLQHEQEKLALREVTTVVEHAAAPVISINDHEQRLNDLQLLLTKAEEEKGVLKSKLNEGDYLQDLAQEKKLQVDFLQNQLEQRIKNYHELEHRATETAGQLQQLQSTVQQFDVRIQALSTELQKKQVEVVEWQSTAQRGQEENQQHQETLAGRTAHIEHLENNLHELQQQQAALQSDMANKENDMAQVRELLQKEQDKAKELESKLELSSQLLVRIYSELARSLNAGWMQGQHQGVPSAIEAPVIEMHKE